MPRDPSPPLRALVVDNEKNIRATLALCLEGLGCSVQQASTAAAAIEALRHSPSDLAFVDLRLGGDSGLDLVPRLLAERPSLDVVVITAYATFDTAVEAVRRGARDYVPKPFTPAQIRHAVERVREQFAGLNAMVLPVRVLEATAREVQSGGGAIAAGR